MCSAADDPTQHDAKSIDVEALNRLPRLWWCPAWGTLNEVRYHGNGEPDDANCGKVAYVRDADLARLVPAEDEPVGPRASLFELMKAARKPAEDEGRLREAAQAVVDWVDTTDRNWHLGYRQELVGRVLALRAAIAATPEPRP